jgi:chaperone BCS1
MDVHVEFKLASKFQACELFRAFYLPPPDKSDDLDEKGVSSTSLDRDLIDLGHIPNALTSRTPHLSRDHLADLARRFGDMLPEREFSMASLQGYLMTYKTRPLEAVEEFDGWIQKERADHLEKTKRVSPFAGISSAGPASPVDAGSLSDSDVEEGA